jgi:hypothetical protein
LIIFVVENRSEACERSRRLGGEGRVASQIEGASSGIPQAGASITKRDVRVFARGRSSSQATIRSIFMAAAVATCCKRVFARPRYRAHRSPKARTPCERVPSTPARYRAHYPTYRGSAGMGDRDAFAAPVVRPTPTDHPQPTTTRCGTRHHRPSA